jgi:hypothetical protein
MNATLADDRIQAVVGVVLQAVDQRLGSVREQLAQLTNTIARNHAELGARIDECQHLVSALHGGAVDDTGTSTGVATQHVSVQLIDAANALTDRVAFLEARVNRYTDDRIAEIRAALRDLAATSPSVSMSTAEPIAVETIEDLLAHASTPLAADLSPEIARLSKQASDRLAATVDRALDGADRPT